MTHNRKTQHWFQFFLSIAFILIALVAVYWKAEAKTFLDKVTHLFTEDTAIATPQGEADSVCTAPCCAGKADETQEKACCPNCTVTEKVDGKTLPSPKEGDACCPSAGSPSQPEADSGRIVWTETMVQEYKAKGDWCTGHGVPESMCVLCNPELVEAFKAKGDWCTGHDLPESLCTVCNKQLIPLGIGRDWCEKHGLPASQCTLCNPKKVGQTEPDNLLIQPMFETLAIETESTAREMEAVLSNPQTGYSKDQRNGINPDCPLHHMKIRLTNSEVAREADLQVEPAGTRQVNESLKCYGDLQYDPSRYAVLSSRAPGIVNSVDVRLGDKVSQGTVLAVIDSTEFGLAKAALLRAQAEVNRCQWLSDSMETGSVAGAVSRKEIIEAKAGLATAEVESAIARQTLLNFGMTSQEIDSTLESKDTSTLLPLRAPFDGTLVELKAVVGQLANPEMNLATVADLSRMTVCLDFQADSLVQLATGMPVIFQSDSLEGESFPGRITWISSSIDPKTRTGKAHAELDNSGGLLRAGLFGQGTVVLHENEEILSIPSDAVQWDGCCNLVFVQQEEDTFIPRKVRVGSESDGYSTILTGLLPGERVVTQGSYLMKTEILKSSIGAGCCAVDSKPQNSGAASVKTAH